MAQNIGIWTFIHDNDGERYPWQWWWRISMIMMMKDIHDNDGEGYPWHWWWRNPWQWWRRILCNIWLKWDNKPTIDYWIYGFMKYNNVARGKCLPSNTTVRKVPGLSNWNKNVIWNPLLNISINQKRLAFLMDIIGSCMFLLHCIKSVMKVHVFYLL